ncbi:flagellar filament capping protein FliD [Domibacillus indicus]|uniref:flagellar filament capping protein FliD n=1 Tax=Domibacillus indicus TaxID=1437523 RepID=UPI0006971546|nr:flagellar filament capping protein FliD [Domibacillus indicus]
MVLRVGGMASGMDTESIIKDLMKAERMPLDKLKQKKQTLEWQRDQYREMNILLQDFRSLVSSTGMKRTQNYRASAAASSNEGLVTATASTAATPGSYNISNVTLAKAETWVTASLKAGGGLDASKSFTDSSNAFDGAFWDTVDNVNVKNGKVGSVTLKGNGSTTGLNVGATDIKIDAAADMSVKVNGVTYKVVSEAPAEDDQVQITSTGDLIFKTPVAADASIKVDYITNSSTEKYTNFSINTFSSTGENIENFLVSSTDSLNSVISKVNVSKAGVTLFYDSVTGKMSMTQKETGSHNPSGGGNISVTGLFATSVLKLDVTNADPADPDKPKLIQGTDASVTINGLTTTRKSNTFEMNGVTFTLKKESTTETASLNVTKDTDQVYNNIKDFVEKYNTLIAAISKKTSEERYRSYTPLTDDQREQLSDKQQEQWEEKAKSGLLRRDTVLSGVLTSMRSNFSQAVINSSTNAAYNQLAEIGITTSKNYLEGGKLEIDETKLKKALAENPEAVEALFIGGGDSTSVSEQGIIHRLYDTVGKTMDQLKERAGSAGYTNQKFAIGRQLTDIDSSISRFEDRLLQVEDRYWKQFTAMEKAMQQANSQSAYLMQQFSM